MTETCSNHWQRSRVTQEGLFLGERRLGDQGPGPGKSLKEVDGLLPAHFGNGWKWAESGNARGTPSPMEPFT